MNILKFNDKYEPLILDGFKTSTIRKNKPKFKTGDVVELSFSKNNKMTGIRAEILDINIMRLSDISEDIVINEGYTDIDELLDDLSWFYPDLKLNDNIYQIKFKVVG